MAERASLTANASSARHVANAERIERQRERQLTADLAQLLATPAGIRVWTHLTGRWSGWRSVFSTDGNGLSMAYYSGQQDVAHELLRMAENAVPGTLAKIRAEEERLDAELKGVSGKEEFSEPETES